MKLLQLLLLTALIVSLKAQTTNSYQNDLQELRNILVNTPSYKAQINGAKAKSFDSLFQQLKKDTVNKYYDYKYFYNLSKLLWPLTDNHLAFSHYIDQTRYKDKKSFEEYLASDEFRNYPTIKNNIDSLILMLNTKDNSSVEGIYNLDSSFTVGVFKLNTNEYIGVVLNSSIKWNHKSIWDIGQIAIHLFEYSPNRFRAYYADPVSKGWILQLNEKYLNNSLINTNLFFANYYKKKYKKVTHKIDFVNIDNTNNKFAYRELNDSSEYLLVSTFQRNSTTTKLSNEFLDTIKKRIHSKNLILDLRNNQGGANSEAKKYFKLLRKYCKNGNLYILMNNETISQAELLILKLKKLKNATTIGQTTKGMLTYGINSDNNTKLPSGKYIVTPTDMRGSKKLLKYENYGISPDIFLLNTKDWIEQTIDVINKE